MSQEVKKVKSRDNSQESGEGMATTGKSWFPTGRALIEFSDRINKSIKTQDQISQNHSRNIMFNSMHNWNQKSIDLQSSPS